MLTVLNLSTGGMSIPEVKFGSNKYWVSILCCWGQPSTVRMWGKSYLHYHVCPFSSNDPAIPKPCMYQKSLGVCNWMSFCCLKTFRVLFCQTGLRTCHGAFTCYGKDYASFHFKSVNYEGVVFKSFCSPCDTKCNRAEVYPNILQIILEKMCLGC